MVFEVDQVECTKRDPGCKASGTVTLEHRLWPIAHRVSFHQRAAPETGSPETRVFRSVRCGVDIRYRMALSLLHEAASVSVAQHLIGHLFAEQNTILLNDPTRMHIGLCTVCCVVF